MGSKNGKARRCREPEYAAYRAAGQTVVGLLLRRPVGRVAVALPGLRVAARRDPDGTRPQVEREIMAGVAGGLAGAKAKRRRGGAAGGLDLTGAMDLALLVCGDFREAQKYLEWLLARTENLLDVPRHWAAVEAIAAELLAGRPIVGRRARRLFREALAGPADGSADFPCTPGPAGR